MKALLSLSLVVIASGICFAEDKKDPTAGKWTIESVSALEVALFMVVIREPRYKHEAPALKLRGFWFE